MYNYNTGIWIAIIMKSVRELQKKLYVTLRND